MRGQRYPRGSEGVVDALDPERRNPVGNCSNDLREGLVGGIDQELGAATEVRQGGLVDVDPHVVIEGREDFLEVDRSFVGFSS